jgi:ATP-dependent exoDNAse (exonuclease V) alpha subunit
LRGKSGYREVAVSAISNQAVNILTSKLKSQKLKFKSGSLAKMLGYKKKAKEDEQGNAYETWEKAGDTKLNINTLLIIDEASMVDEEKLEQILDIAKQYGLKLLFVGDKYQLSPIREGAYYRNKKELQNKTSPVFNNSVVNGQIHYLTDIIRQKDNSPIITLGQRFVMNEDKGFEHTIDKIITKTGVVETKAGTVEVIDTTVDFVTKGIDEYKEAIKTDNKYHVNIIVPTKALVETYNNEIHRALFHTDQPFVKGEVVTLYEGVNDDEGNVIMPNSHRAILQSNAVIREGRIGYTSDVYWEGEIAMMSIRDEDGHAHSVMVPLGKSKDTKLTYQK